MIYPTRGGDWSWKELDDIVMRLKMREPSEPFLGHAADAVEFLMGVLADTPADCPECGTVLREN